eukprot:CAMPEP_0201586756 /NCGR_PEP_ID=MMETSP0190_2-20130828/135868_1 /ASSEMBLY_ACC=CAM_ASM_000263 /TAXON_ID=37353 /ORGANISM="Rosalina sp." /LENGTH=47 /DNA_ID= /DNA_START= /DNA_END= /DNA_ORIENTATION=
MGKKLKPKSKRPQSPKSSKPKRRDSKGSLKLKRASTSAKLTTKSLKS